MPKVAICGAEEFDEIGDGYDLTMTKSKEWYESMGVNVILGAVFEPIPILGIEGCAQLRAFDALGDTGFASVKVRFKIIPDAHFPDSMRN